MTRLTNYMRDTMFRKIMKGIPNRDYESEIFDLVQGVVRDFMPKKLQAVYDDPKLRQFLNGANLRLTYGSNTRYAYAKESNGWRSRSQVLGLEKELTVRINDMEHEGVRAKEGTMYHHLLFKTNLVELYHGWVAQDELRDKVEKRLKANLASVSTIKRLYDVLEPELHHYIPVETAKEPLLPATVAPVVDDLKKLGFVAPEVPKAEVVK